MNIGTENNPISIRNPNWNLQFLNNESIIKTKVLLPRA